MEVVAGQGGVKDLRSERDALGQSRLRERSTWLVKD